MEHGSIRALSVYICGWYNHARRGSRIFTIRVFERKSRVSRKGAKGAKECSFAPLRETFFFQESMNA